MVEVQLYHPELGRTIRVSESAAAVLRRSGWQDPPGAGDDHLVLAEPASSDAQGDASGGSEESTDDGDGEGRPRDSHGRYLPLWAQDPEDDREEDS